MDTQCEMFGCEYDGPEELINQIHMQNHGDFWICEDCHEELKHLQAYRPTDADTWIAISLGNDDDIKNKNTGDR